MKTKNKIKELNEIIRKMSWYLNHTENCGLNRFDMCDTCTCNMNEIKKEARKLYEETK